MNANPSMRGGVLLPADVPGHMQEAVAKAAFSVTVNCEKLKKIIVVSGVALTRTVRWTGDGSELMEAQL